MECSKDIFGRNLARYIEAKGKTQKEIAEYLGVSAPTVSDWINGQNRNARQLCRLLEKRPYRG